jgi:hypothetical protein
VKEILCAVERRPTVGRRRKKKHRKHSDQEITGDDDDNYVMTMNLPAIMRCIKENKSFRSFLFIS